MKICPKCGAEHDKRGTYCSRTCANSREWSEEDKQKKSKVAKDYLNNLTQEECAKVKERLRENAKRCNNIKASGVDYILNTHFDLLAWQSKRLRVILEQDCKCLHCGLDKWMNEELPLEIDHIDGNNKNNERDNLRALCPNCHSLTDTWRGRKSKVSKRQKKLNEFKNIVTNT